MLRVIAMYNVVKKIFNIENTQIAEHNARVNRISEQSVNELLNNPFYCFMKVRFSWDSF